MEDQDIKALLVAIARVNGHSHPEDWAQKVMDEMAPKPEAATEEGV